MIIRSMVVDDIPQLSKLYMQFWNEPSDINKMQEQFFNINNNQTHILLSAIENDKLVGSVMGIICQELYGDCRPFLVIENMIVDKDYARKGIGKSLLHELESIAKKKDCTQMILVTECDRLDACSFYENYGFQTNSKGYKKKII